MVPPEIPDPQAFVGDPDGPSDHCDPHLGRVQCPNCCKMADVTRRSMGLLFYRCGLCETVGAIPETSD